MGKYSITVKQGTDWSLTLTWYTDEDQTTLRDLTGWTGRMQIRQKHTSADEVEELTTENGGITIGGANGTITLAMTDLETAALPAGNYVYDLEVIDTVADVRRPIEGTLVVTPEVTR